MSKQSPNLEQDDNAKRLGDSRRPLAATIALRDDLSIEDNDAPNYNQSVRETLTNGATDPPSPQISKASQTEPQDTVTSTLDAIIDSTINDVERQPTSPPKEPEAQSELERNRIQTTIASPSGSPGVDPKKAIPVSSEDIRSFPETSAKLFEADLGSERAWTVHLPAREVREGPLREVDQSQGNAMRRDKREDEKHPPSGGVPVATDPASSPSSTVGPYSTATPGHNMHSPDTSPGDEIISDEKLGPEENMQSTDRTEDNARAPETEHDNLLRSQMDIARLAALGMDPSTPDAQLRLEEARSLRTSDILSDNMVRPSGISAVDSTSRLVESEALTNAAGEVVRDTLDDEDDEVVSVPTPQDEMGFEQPNRGESDTLEKVNVPKDTDWHLEQAGCERNRESDEYDPQKLHSSGKSNMHIDTHHVMTRNELSDIDFTRTTTSPDQLSTPSGTHSTDAVKQTTASPSEPLTTTTQQRPALTTPIVQPPPERMTTRVSSGAIRHKSVSEILGETPRLSAISVDKHLPDNERSSDSSKDNSAAEISSSGSGIGTPQFPGPRLRLGERKEKEKERSKLSTVVFAKPQSLAKLDTSDLRQQNNNGLKESRADTDYLYTLFVAQASSQPRTQPLNTLLASAHKTVTTANHYVDFHEQQDCRMLKRIYQLQYSNRWSLRQIERSVEPVRPTTHWDVLLGHMKWLRTDFREERKWKMTTAKNLADWCAEWIVSSVEERILLQVRRRPTKAPNRKSPETADQATSQVDIRNTQDSQSTPDLVPSAETDSVSDVVEEDERHSHYFSSVPPAALFSLALEDVTFDLRRTAACEKILSELPLYEPRRDAPVSELPTSLICPDADWKIPCLPISKFTLGKMVSKQEGPPRKRSRYEYEVENQEIPLDFTGFSNESSLKRFRPPEQDDVALFNPENKHIRDRIHAGHAFRPPSEYNMPTQSFFESRQSSQWTWNEDDELRRLVKEYAYNWSLISSCLSTSSLFSSGAERRTPWECFERWVGLEGLPADMSKTQYFRAYHARMEAAQKTLLAQQQVAQQQQGNNPAQPPTRRRTAQPVRVERRKNNKHLALIDAMRKLAKKRETSVQKQQHGKHPFLPGPAASVHSTPILICFFYCGGNIELMFSSCWVGCIEKSQRGRSATGSRSHTARFQSPEIRPRMQNAREGRGVPPASPCATEGMTRSDSKPMPNADNHL